MLSTILFMLAQNVTDPTDKYQEYRRCVLDQAIVYSQLDEPADNIAIASETHCVALNKQWRQALLKDTRDARLRRTMVDLIEDMEGTIRGQAIKAVLDSRLEAMG